MKIAFIVTRFPCLSETFILNQITGLIDRGYQVDIFAKVSEDQSVMHVDIENYNLLKHTFYYGSLYETMPANKFLRLIKAVNLMLRNLHKPMPLLKSLNIFKFGARAISLSLFFETLTFLEHDIDKYEIVHCHFGPTGRLGALLKDVGAITGKLVTKFYGHDVSTYIKRNGNRVYDHLFQKGDLFLPISNRMKKTLLNLGCPEQKIVIHNLGVDTGKFAFHPRQPSADGKVHLLTISRLVEKKGVKYGIQAVAKVLEHYPHIEYKIVGDGPLRDEFQGLIDTLNVKEQINLLGWKEQAEVVELVQGAHILLAPSVTSKTGDEEGTPVVLMEALAQGLPAISTLHSGIPEIVQDGESGFLVPEKDVDMLVEKLTYLVDHQELWGRMGKAGRDYVETHFDINKLNDRLVTIYEECNTQN